MNVPQGETYPLQGGNMYYPNAPPMGQPSMGQSIVVQNNTVNVHREMPRDHFIWSLCCFISYNPFCLGLAALIHTIKARDRKVVGDIEGARAYGSTARTLNIISTVLFCLGFLIFIIVISVTLSNLSSYASSYGSYGNRYGNSYGNSYGK